MERVVSDHRPDEEGIKTGSATLGRAPARFQTTDLMKKGLRPCRGSGDSADSSFQTTDLMKKGLRPRRGARDAWCSGFRPQT